MKAGGLRLGTLGVGRPVLLNVCVFFPIRDGLLPKPLTLTIETIPQGRGWMFLDTKCVYI